MGEDEDPLDGYKLLLVPVRSIRALSRGLPQQAVLDGGTFEVVGDVDPDRKLRMSRLLYDEVEVIG